MLPAKAFYDQLATILTAAGPLAGNVVDLRIAPVIAPFTQNLQNVFTDVTLGTDDLAYIASGAAPFVGMDPLTLQWRISLSPPIGGWTWHLAGTTPTLPVTIYGFAFYTNDGNDLLATWQYNVPVIIAEAPTTLEFTEGHFNLLIPPIV